MVRAIRKAFNNLSMKEREQIPDDALVKLVQAENIITKLEIEQKKDEEQKPEDDKNDENTEGDSSDNKTEGA